eukprot:2631793-Rhodomonas_salina.1
MNRRMNGNAPVITPTGSIPRPAHCRSASTTASQYSPRRSKSSHGADGESPGCRGNEEEKKKKRRRISESYPQSTAK